MLETLSVEKQQHSFYAYWVHQFFNQFQRNRRRRDLGRTDIDAFLQRLTSNPNTTDWQVKLALDVFRMCRSQAATICHEHRTVVKAVPTSGYEHIGVGNTDSSAHRILCHENRKSLPTRDSAVCRLPLGPTPFSHEWPQIHQFLSYLAINERVAASTGTDEQGISGQS